MNNIQPPHPIQPFIAMLIIMLQHQDTLYMPLDKDKPWYVKMKEEGASKEEIDEERAKRKKIKPIKVLRL